MGAIRKLGINSKRPDVFVYHDIREYLRNLFEYLKSKNQSFSLRKLSQKSGLSVGLLPQVLSNRVQLTSDVLEKIIPHLDLPKTEVTFLRWLRQLSESSNHEERMEAYERIRRYGQYSTKNQETLTKYKYLTKWYYPVVRELVRWKSFRLEAEWVRDQLRDQITLAEAQDALNFLVRERYILFDFEGRPHLSDNQIECAGGVYKIAMAEYHSQVLNLARESIYTVASNDRDLNAMTVSFPAEKIIELKQIFEKAMRDIMALSDKSYDKNDSIIQVSLLAFPVAKERA